MLSGFGWVELVLFWLVPVAPVVPFSRVGSDVEVALVDVDVEVAWQLVVVVLVGMSVEVDVLDVVVVGVDVVVDVVVAVVLVDVGRFALKCCKVCATA